MPNIRRLMLRAGACQQAVNEYRVQRLHPKLGKRRVLDIRI
jgi:hypothetical protein